MHVRGTLHTPPSWTATSANVGPNGSVGDNSWVDSGYTGMEAGHAKNDALQSYPDATLPDTGGKIWIPAPPPVTFTVNGLTYTNYIILTTNNPWYINNLNSGLYVNGPNVLVWLKGMTAIIPSGKTIEIPNRTDAAGNSYSLAMYVSAPSFAVVSVGIANDGGLAKNFQYYGLSSNTSITLGGNGDFTAQIYAPEADFSLGGGGSTDYDFSGASVTKSLRVNGHFNFHLDETLLFTVHVPSVGPVLGPVSFSAGNQLQFTVSGLTGLTYVVQASPNLTDWIRLATNTSPFTFTDNNFTNFPQRFYRAMYLP